MGRLSDFFTELKARRAGRAFAPRGIQKSARHIIGPTGNGFSSAWDRLAESGDAFLESFDPKTPPSLFVSQRERTHLNQPIPLVERRIEAHYADGSDDLTAEELEWGSRPPER